MCFTSLKSTSVYALCSAAPAPLTAQFLLLRYALQHMRVLQFNSAASAAITRRAAARQELHLLRPALLCPSKLLASALNRKTGQRPRPATQLLRACLLCLLRLAAAAAGRRGVARQVWRVLQSKVAVWREQWGACLPNNRLASHELHSSPSAHHALNRPITSGSKAIKQGRKWFAAAAAGALCGSFPRARTRAALSRQIALIYLCNRVLGEMRLKAKRGQSSSAQSPQ